MLVDVGQVLASFVDCFVVVGGWVPDLLLPEAEEPHIGSIDVDLALDVRKLKEGRYADMIKLLRDTGRYRKGEKEFQLAVTLPDLVDAKASVTFDLDGSGLPRRWGWITPKAAWLVYDPDSQGRITSALQMFGNVTFWIFWRDGYEALRSLDDNHDGLLRGAELRGIALWQDRNGNGICDPGEVRPVSEWGITTISCDGEAHSTGIMWSPKGVAFTNGDSRPTYDWIAPSRLERND